GTPCAIERFCSWFCCDRPRSPVASVSVAVPRHPMPRLERTMFPFVAITITIAFAVVGALMAVLTIAFVFALTAARQGGCGFDQPRAQAAAANSVGSGCGAQFLEHRGAGLGCVAAGPAASAARRRSLCLPGWCSPSRF